MNQLDQFVLIDHLPRRRGQIAPDLEGRAVGHVDVQPPTAAFQIVQKVAETVQQAAAIGFKETLTRGRVQRQVIAGRQRAEQLPRIEPHAQTVLVTLGQGLDQAVGGAFDGQMHVAQAAAQRIAGPAPVAEAAVLAVLALARPGPGPGLGAIGPQIDLELRQRKRVLRQLHPRARIGLCHRPGI